MTESGLVRSEDYDDKEDRIRLNFDLKMSRLRCAGNPPHPKKTLIDRFPFVILTRKQLILPLSFVSINRIINTLILFEFCLSLGNYEFNYRKLLICTHALDMLHFPQNLSTKCDGQGFYLFIYISIGK